MLGLGFPEIIFILVLALLIFGPKKLPEIGRTLGKGLGEFRRATDDLKRTFEADMREVDEDVRETRRAIEAPATAVPREEAPMARTAPLAPAVAAEPGPDPDDVAGEAAPSEAPEPDLEVSAAEPGSDPAAEAGVTAPSDVPELDFEASDSQPDADSSDAEPEKS